MRIDDNFAASSELVRSTQVDRAQQAETDPAGRRQGGPAPADTASLSALSSKLAQGLEADPPETVQAIAQLQEAVNSGTLQAPPEEIAAAIVSQSLIDQQLEAQQGQPSNPLAPPSP